VKLDQYNARVRVTGSEEEHAWLFEYLAFRDKTRDYLARTRQWMDPFVRMYNTRSATFPAGLLGLVLKAAPEAGLPVEHMDHRKVPTTLTLDHAGLMSLGLRDYQADALLAVGAHGRGIVKIATAGGKGSIAASFPVAFPCRWLFLVHRAQIARDIGARYAAITKLQPGYILEGGVELGDGEFVVATYQTLRKRIAEPVVANWLETIGGVVYDEAHVVGAETFAHVAGQLHAPYFRVGMSGTPLQRGDGRSALVLAHTGPVIYEASAADLVAEGWVSPVRVHAYHYHHPTGYDRRTWSGVYSEAVARNKARVLEVAAVVKVVPKPALVFVTALAHGKALVKAMERQGMKAQLASGSVSIDRRNTMNRDLVAGRLDVVVATKVYEEGIDIPSLASVVHAGGGKSEIGTLQRIGRGMRLSEGKTHVEVVDILDEECPVCATIKQSMWHLSCRWLHRHSGARLAAYRREKHTVVEVSNVTELVTSLGGAP
jgi:superfamily II DNA or RNA helicase